MTVRGAGFWGYRWEGYPHEQLYAMVTTGKGAGVVTPAQDAWASFTRLMNESMDRIERLQREAGVSWQGQAAGAMRDGVSPLTRWAQESATAGEQTNTSLRQIADGFSHTANTMPEPVVVPSKVAQGIPGDFPGLLAGQTDEDPTDRRAQQAHQQAIELMTGYTANNVQSTDTAGTFADPPEVGVTAAPRTEPGGSAGGVIDTSSPGDSGHQAGPGSQSGPGGQGGHGHGGEGGPASGRRPSGAPVPASTDPAQVAAPPPRLSGAGQSAGSTAPANPFVPVGGVPADPATGRPAGSGPGRGLSGGGPGRGSPGGTSGGTGGGTGGVPGAAPGRGNTAGPGAPATENATGTRTTTQPGSRGGAAGGGGPVPGAGRRDEDKERPSPEYLRDYNDEFWDDTPPVAPAVIGVDDD